MHFTKAKGQTDTKTRSCNTQAQMAAANPRGGLIRDRWFALRFSSHLHMNLQSVYTTFRNCILICCYAVFPPPREKFHLNVTSYLKKIGLYIQVLLFHTTKLFHFTKKAFDINHLSHLSISLLNFRSKSSKKKKKMIFSHFPHSDSFTASGVYSINSGGFILL